MLSHGTWAIAHGNQLGVRPQDAGFHNPSFVHRQVKGIPPGFCRRSVAAQKRRAEAQWQKRTGPN
eukprot:2108027-Amphidinium_carterae.1